MGSLTVYHELQSVQVPYVRRHLQWMRKNFQKKKCCCFLKRPNKPPLEFQGVSTSQRLGLLSHLLVFRDEFQDVTVCWSRSSGGFTPLCLTELQFLLCVVQTKTLFLIMCAQIPSQCVLGRCACMHACVMCIFSGTWLCVQEMFSHLKLFVDCVRVCLCIQLCEDLDLDM